MKTVQPNISSKIEHLPRSIIKILKLAGSIADNRACCAYAVGGFVRDILLGVKNFDVDIVVEGDGLAFAVELTNKLNGSLVMYKRFGTATIVQQNLKIDIATARKEYYEAPAALPTVSFSSIREDLYRRDFTINAIAVSLNKVTFGNLIDFFDGRADLKSKRIRALHDLSFVDDPTRIFRAIRFEQRYSFTIAPHTENLIKKALNLNILGRTSGQRLRNEIILILSEEAPKEALKRMHQLHELKFIHPGIKLNKRMLKLFDNIDELRRRYRFTFAGRHPLDSWIIYFMAMIDNISLTQAQGLCEKFTFTKADEKRIISSKKDAKSALRMLENRKPLAPSVIYKALFHLSYEALVFIMVKARTRIARDRVWSFLKCYAGARVFITGEDLKGLGIRPGPGYKKIFDKILYEKLDGRLTSRKQELTFAASAAGRKSYGNRPS